MPSELIKTVPKDGTHATIPTNARRDSFVVVAQATRQMVSAIARIEHGRPLAGASGGRELRIALVLIGHLTTWCRLSDSLSRSSLAAMLGVSESTVTRSMKPLSEGGVVNYTPGRQGCCSVVGFPVATGAQVYNPPSGEPADLAVVSETTRAFVAQSLTADLAPSALLLAAVLVAELATWTRLDGDITHSDLIAKYGFSRSGLKRAFHALADAGLISYVPGVGHQPTYVAIAAAPARHPQAAAGEPAVVGSPTVLDESEQLQAPWAIETPSIRNQDLTRYVDELRVRVNRWGGPARDEFLRELDQLRPTSRIWPLLEDAATSGWDPGYLANEVLNLLPAQVRKSWVGLVINLLADIVTRRPATSAGPSAPALSAWSPPGSLAVGPPDGLAGAELASAPPAAGSFLEGLVGGLVAKMALPAPQILQT